MHRRKKSPALGEITAHAEAWKAQWPNSHGYQLAAQELCESVGHLLPRQLPQLTAHTIVARWKAKYTAGTAWQRRAGLKNFLKYLETYGAPKIELPKLHKPQPRGVIATPAQLDALVQGAPPYMRLFTLLCWQLALRFSEALRVTPASYDPTARTITVTVKGGHQRRIPTTPLVEELITVASHIGDRDTSCVDLLHGSHLTAQAMHQHWWKHARAKNAPGIRPHDLRRTTATALYAVSKDLRAVQQYLGHSELTSTTHYLAPLGEEQIRHYHQLLNFHRFHSEVKQ